jgi:AAA+ ATPase superfamily predicted ATPase
LESNPFITVSYPGSELFCGREEETIRLVTIARSTVNTILLGPPRMGKSALIGHVFRKLEQNNEFKCLYMDIHATENLKEFTKVLHEAILKAFPEKGPVNFDFTSPRQNENLVLSLFEFLDKRNIRIVIAIDEFQQITQYPEKNTISILRQATQKLKHISFIFSCSNEYLLNDFFSEGRQAFFTNFDLLQLAGIRHSDYSDFIKAHFEDNEKNISEEAVNFILEWTRRHTYYTQALCHQLFSKNISEIDIEQVHEECGLILQENESSYFIYRKLLSPVQWLLLKAIAKEEKVYHPTAKAFLQQHNIGTPANVQRALEALLSKEVVYAAHDERGRYYQVYDCFLSRWLEGLD